MKRDTIKLNNPKKYATVPVIAPEKIEKAISTALARLEKMGKRGGLGFPAVNAYYSKYLYRANNNWEAGMYAGCFWLASMLTKDNGFFLEKANALTKTFDEREKNKVAMDNHDVGFSFSPSSVAGYKMTGSEEYKETALSAAKYFYEHSYSKEGKFIIRGWRGAQKGDAASYRTMMDSLFNAPLLFWAGKETGNEEYTRAALDHVKTTEKYLIRADGSSFHHYQFDLETHKALHGVTFQGRSDDSTWARGQSWGVYGFPIAYSYTKEPFIKDVHRDVTYFMLNHLPSDMIPYWDYDFVDGDEPRDSSSGAISACGLFEMAKYLDENDPDKTVFRSAAVQLLEAVIDRCTDLDLRDDGLINHVTHALPQKMGIDQTAVYGDYFYLEALLRYVNPDFKMFW